MTSTHSLPDPWSGPDRTWRNFLRDAWHLARPYFQQSEDRWKARLMLALIDKVTPVRTTQAEENLGLDESLHGESAYERSI